ncbi:hypothetical protein [Burkholderia stagnalis]
MTLAERIADLIHNVTALDSIAQLALADAYQRVGHYARLASTARYGARADHTDTERAESIALIYQLSEQYEAQAREHHQSLSMAFAKRWLMPGDDGSSPKARTPHRMQDLPRAGVRLSTDKSLNF